MRLGWHAALGWQWKPEFSAGDRVTWTKKHDPDVPPGTVGIVRGYDEEGRAMVKFPKGEWHFKEAHLREVCPEFRARTRGGRRWHMLA